MKISKVVLQNWKIDSITFLYEFSVDLYFVLFSSKGTMNIESSIIWEQATYLRKNMYEQILEYANFVVQFFPIILKVPISW